LIDQLYDSLATQNFDLTARMSEYALRAPFSSDESRRIAVINVAIALKALQRPEEVKRVLQGLDWTACSLKFQVALATLHDQHDRLLELLPRAIAGGEMTKATAVQVSGDPAGKGRDFLGYWTRSRQGRDQVPGSCCPD